MSDGQVMDVGCSLLSDAAKSDGRSAFETASDANGNFSVTIPYFSKYFLQIIDESGNQHKVSFEIMKYRTEVSNREIVVVKDIFNQKEEQK